MAGLCYAPAAHTFGSDNLGLAHKVSHLMALAVWFTFGAMIAQEFAHRPLGCPPIREHAGW
ncbi:MULTISPECIES: hypothetical protein [unclassified Streptomyces]|uniref:hypothetical protein n=1 Tax=unclassified Streptomyces TaxID=2593676 RepID=UPI00131B67BF|nr:hypothetical protein [Streptomyces sp. CB01635]